MGLFKISGKKGILQRDSMVDVEKLISDYAWKQLAETNILDKLFKNIKYIIEVNKSYLEITHNISAFEPKDFKEFDNIINKKKENKIEKKIKKRNICLFETKFENNSRQNQTFSFKTDRKTRSRCVINIQNSFTLGGKVELSMKIPLNFLHNKEIEEPSLSGGLNGEFQITKATGQTLEEELSWGVNSQITVEPGKKIKASLEITEVEFMAEFTLESTIRGIDKIIPVYIKNKKNKNIIEILEIPSENLPDILTPAYGFTKEKEDIGVIYKTKGIMKTVFGTKQKIKLESENIIINNNNNYDNYNYNFNNNHFHNNINNLNF